MGMLDVLDVTEVVVTERGLVLEVVVVVGKVAVFDVVVVTVTGEVVLV